MYVQLDNEERVYLHKLYLAKTIQELEEAKNKACEITILHNKCTGAHNCNFCCIATAYRKCECKLNSNAPVEREVIRRGCYIARDGVQVENNHDLSPKDRVVEKMNSAQTFDKLVKITQDFCTHCKVKKCTECKVYSAFIINDKRF